MIHDLYMAETDSHHENGPDDPKMWDRGLNTEQVIAKITEQLPVESDGDGLTILVVTHDEAQG